MSRDSLWAAIEAAGPSEGDTTFDPLLVDDVLAAERAGMQYDRRKSFVAAFAWAVPTREAIERIRDATGGRRVLEVCAGGGLWARLLSDAGVWITATDAVSSVSGPHFPVETVDAEAAVTRYADCRALLLCWPPFKETCAFRALRAFEGDLLVSIGDPRFTADEAFHALLAAEWRLLDQVPLPSWPGTNDSVRIRTRAKPHVAR